MIKYNDLPTMYSYGRSDTLSESLGSMVLGTDGDVLDFGCDVKQIGYDGFWHLVMLQKVELQSKSLMGLT